MSDDNWTTVISKRTKKKNYPIFNSDQHKIIPSKVNIKTHADPS